MLALSGARKTGQSNGYALFLFRARISKIQMARQPWLCTKQSSSCSMCFVCRCTSNQRNAQACLFCPELRNGQIKSKRLAFLPHPNIKEEVIRQYGSLFARGCLYQPFFSGRTASVPYTATRGLSQKRKTRENGAACPAFEFDFYLMIRVRAPVRMLGEN